MAFDTWGGEIIALGVVAILVLALLVLAPLWWWHWRPEARRARSHRERLAWLEATRPAPSSRPHRDQTADSSNDHDAR